MSTRPESGVRIELREAGGRVFFFDLDSQKATWSDPRLNHAHWQILVDDATRKTYWYNRTTGVSTWEEPMELVAPRAAVDQALQVASGKEALRAAVSLHQHPVQLGPAVSLSHSTDKAEREVDARDDIAGPLAAGDTMSSRLKLYLSRKESLDTMKRACVTIEDYDGAILINQQLKQLAAEFSDIVAASSPSSMSSFPRFSRLSLSGDDTMSTSSNGTADGVTAANATNSLGRESFGFGRKRKSMNFFSSLRHRDSKIRERVADSVETSEEAVSHAHQRHIVATSRDLSRLDKQGESEQAATVDPGTGDSGSPKAPRLAEIWSSLARRKSSFDTYKWPLQNPCGDDMAMAGFYMLPSRGSRKDRVACWTCGLTLSLWEENDNPLLEHGRFRPHCAAVLATMNASDHDKASVRSLDSRYRSESNSSRSSDGRAASEHLTTGGNPVDLEPDAFDLSTNLRRWRSLTVSQVSWRDIHNDGALDVFFSTSEADNYLFEGGSRGVQFRKQYKRVFEEEDNIAYFSEFLSLIPHSNYVAGNARSPLVITLEDRIGNIRALVRMPKQDLRVLLQVKSSSTSRKRVLRETLPAELWPHLESLTLTPLHALKPGLKQFDDDFSTATGRKFGVLYCDADQCTEREMLSNREDNIPDEFWRFCEFLGAEVDLQTHRDFSGGLTAADARSARYTCWKEFELMFHVAPKLKHKEGDQQQVCGIELFVTWGNDCFVRILNLADARGLTWTHREKLLKKRHIGNDTVNIIFQTGDAPIDLSTFTSKFTYVYVLVRPVVLPEGENGRSSVHYRMAIACKDGVVACTPVLPSVPILDPTNPVHRDLFMSKILGLDRAAQHAPAYLKRIEQARLTALARMLTQHPPIRPSAVKTLRDRSRRGSAGVKAAIESPIATRPIKVAFHREDDPEDSTRGVDLRHFEAVQSRLATYTLWPHERPTAEVMAASGLFLLPFPRTMVRKDATKLQNGGSGSPTATWDKVKCYSCRVVMGGWDEDDDPLFEHRKMSGHLCKFLKVSTQGHKSKKRFPSLRKGKASKRDAARRAYSASAGEWPQLEVCTSRTERSLSDTRTSSGPLVVTQIENSDSTDI